jgi:hypothetical protein
MIKKEEIQKNEKDSCTCNSCSREYRIDLIVKDSMWEKIKPKNKPEGAGLLCGSCIIARIESLEESRVYFIKETN